MSYTIALPRATVQQALAALEDWWGSFPDFRSLHDKVAIAALRTALEQQADPDVPEVDFGNMEQQAEPVCEVIDGRGEVDWISFVPPAGTPLYTAPPQRKTEREQDEIDVLRDSVEAKADRIDRLGEMVERLTSERDALLKEAVSAAHAKRLALELECLLLNPDNTSRFWDSAHQALEDYRAECERQYPQDHVSPLGKD